jgi:hypothetical protein
MPISCESAFVFCEDISTCFSDSDFNYGNVVGDEESWGWSIRIKEFFEDNSDADAELECGIYVGVDSGTCSADSGVRVGTVEIKKDSVEYLLNPGSKASSFQLYAGKCVGSYPYPDGSCNSFDVQANARRPESYPLNATLDSSATNFTFAADNQQDYMKTYMWGKSELNIFEQDYLSIHAYVCTAARADLYSSSDSGSDATRRNRALQANSRTKQSRPSWPTNLMPRGPTYHASSSPNRFPTSTPTSLRNVPPSKIPTAAPSSLPSIEPTKLPTTVLSKLPTSWPTDLPTCRTCEFDQ